MHNTVMNKLNIAETIRAQLGGNKFVVMTGAKNFVGGSNFLQFHIGRGATNKANVVRITLDPSDTYTIEYFYCRGVNVKARGTVSGVYADKMRASFTTSTGMDTSL